MSYSRKYFLLLAVILPAMFATARASYAEAVAQQYQQGLQDLSQAMDAYRNWTKPREGYKAESGRDPMRSLIDPQGNVVSSVGMHGGLALQGIIVSKDFTAALIDDEFFAKGDKVGPYKLLDIQPDGVKVERDSKIQFIPLYQETKVQKEIPADAELKVIPGQVQRKTIPSPPGAVSSPRPQN